MKSNYVKGLNLRNMGLWLHMYKAEHFLSFDGLTQVDGIKFRKDLGKRRFGKEKEGQTV